ncbi:hypothetical protein PAMP_005123 [Pampus punctatissimus]
MNTTDEKARVVQIYPRLSQDTITYCPLQVSAGDTTRTVIHNAVVTLGLDSSLTYSLLEVRKSGGEEWMLQDGDCPLDRVLLWPQGAQKWHPESHGYYFILQLQQLNQTSREEYDDLCNLPAVTEDSILEALRKRFCKHKIYTYASNILIAINPNKFLPVYYNPKYIKMYENQPLGKLSPHIFAIADVAYRAMQNRQVNQCIVISGESGSGKTESSSYLIHCLTALSQKTYSSGLERTILGASPVLEEDLLVDDEEKLGQEYKRLHQAMEMVGFLASTKKRIFSVLSAILHLGNVTYTQSKDTQVLEVGPADVLSTLSVLLKVKKELLVKALTNKRVVTSKGTVVSHYTLQEATTMRDSMAKSLYSALFDWIILHINHALLNRRDMEESVSEDYMAEGITWQNINYADNTGRIQLISEKHTGLFDLLDEESNLPQATDETLLFKFKQQHQDNAFFVPTTYRKPTFVIQHFAGRVKYHIKDFREKNTDHMRPEVISLLRSSERAFLHHLVASSPEALFRWGILRATIRILTVFKSMGRRHAELIAARHASRKYLKDMKGQNNPIGRLSSSSLDFSFDRSDELPLDVFEDIFANFEKRNSQTLYFIHQKLMDLRSLKHIVGLAAHDRTSKSILHPHQRTKPPTISSQFQASLRKLMDKIEKAEPSFIFCMRSNAEKKELHFDDELVLQQIKHTGLLQMVHIQKSGYSAKYTFKEFVDTFRMLLPKGATATPEHITELFKRMDLDKTAYQIGKTKVFLKEKERQLLHNTLNKEVIRHIINLQRWFRACLLRLHFLQKKDATMIIQRSWREFYENQNRAATVIQTAWRSSLKKHQNKMEGEEKTSNTRPGRVSLTNRELKRQHKVESSPNRTQQLDPINGQSAQRARSKEKREIRGSPPPLNRPLSLPLDPKYVSDSDSISPLKSSCLQRYKDGGIKEKAERWREKMSEGEPTDESSPEIRRRRENRKVEFQRKGKSMSADELSKISSSGSDSSPSKNEVKVRFRKQPKRKRRLAWARSGLAINFAGSKESEYWSFPLPPMSPNMPSLKSSASSMDVRALKSQVKVLTEGTDHDSPLHAGLACIPAEPDGSRFSLPPSSTNEESGQHITTPESYTPHPYHMTDQTSGRVSRNPTIRISRATRVLESNASLDREITDPKELRNLDEFLGNQVNELQSRIKELSPTESIFLTATMQFRETIKGMYSLQKPQIGYKDLMKGYHNKVNALASPKQKSELSLVVNLFQSVLDGFIRGERKRAEYEPVKDDRVPGSLHFGVQVCVLTSQANPVPKVVELLLMYVELNGLYTEGIYRKSGSTCRARELHQILETDPEGACLENYPIHTITGLVKRWLRELPDPLMTFSLYSDFLRAVELPEKSQRIRAVYQKVDELPSANYNTLERLIFHLVRVAKEEKHNKMSANSLAIVFAPCILRSPDANDPFLGMKDVSKTTLCVEILISEQFRRYTEKMQNIQELEYAEALAVNQLRLKRQNTIVEKPSELEVRKQIDSDETEKTLIERIRSIKQEKVDLACRLPDLEQEHSDNENLDSSSSMSTESLEDRLRSLDSEGKVTMRLNTQKPACPYKPPDLAQRVRSLMAETENQQRELTSVKILPRHTDVTQSICFMPSQNNNLNSSLTGKLQVSKTSNGNFDDMDIPYIDEDEDLTCT